MTNDQRPDSSTGAPDQDPADDRPEVALFALIAANAVPVIGVLWFGWQVFPIILLYWSENVVVGAFNVLKIIWAQPDQPIEWIAKVFAIPFFCVHFGMFTFVHGIFVLDLFGGPAYEARGFPSPHTFGDAIARTGIGYAMLALVLSHGVSFAWNYVLGGEYRRASIGKLMGQPYARVMILHFVILLGGLLVGVLHAPVAALILLIALKITVDVASHRRERERA
jgi:hypothetical protein